MKVKRSRYQNGSIRRVERAKGFAWEVRFSEVGATGQKNKYRSLYFSSAEYPTEADVRKALVQTVGLRNSKSERVKADANFGAITQLYRSEHLPTLQHSTQQTNLYVLTRYVEPRWSAVRIRQVTPLAITTWLRELKLAPTSKASIRSVLSQCFELAALHNFVPQTERNPMSLVKIKGTSERQKPITILSEANFRKLVNVLPEPLNLIVLITGCLGLRVSEALALKWEDIDSKAGTIAIQRKFTHGALGMPKTTASGVSLPLDATLRKILGVWKPKAEDSEWIFPSDRTGGVRSASALLTKGIKPAAMKAGFGRVTWHTLRHSCRTWLDSEGASVGTQKDLLRHADVSTTMNRYGKALPPEMKRSHERLVKNLVPSKLLKQ